MMGLLKADAASEVTRLQTEFTGHLAQPLLRIRAAGRLCGEAGEKAGFMILLEAPALEHARSYLETDPFLRDGLYEQVHLLEFAPEAGSL
jgi:uncharacterized protein YciI